MSIPDAPRQNVQALYRQEQFAREAEAARCRPKSNLEVLGVESVWDSLEFQQTHFGYPELRLVVEDYLVLLVGGGGAF